MHEAWENSEEKAHETARLREAGMTRAREKAVRIMDSAYTAGITLHELEAISLAMGGCITVNHLRYVSTTDGDLFALGQDKKREEKKRLTNLRRLIEKKRSKRINQI